MTRGNMFTPMDFTDPDAFPNTKQANNQQYNTFGLLKQAQSVDHSTKQLIQSLADIVVSKQTGLLQSESTLATKQSTDNLVPYRPLSYLDTHVNVYETLLKQLDPSSTSLLAINSANQTFTRAIHDQWSTLVLCHHLHQAKQQIRESNLSSSNSNSQSTIAPSRDFRYSNQNAIQHIMDSSADLIHAHAVTAWLEEIASDVVVESRGSVEFKRTLRKLQLSNSNALLSIDGVNLSNQPAYAHVDANDIQDENTLLRCVWQYIRAGKLLDAIELCSSFDQSWRVASLLGAQPWDQTIEDGQIVVNGNRKHFLWKQTCRAIASNSSMSLHERAVYGLLGSTLESVFLVAQTWEDAVWASFRVSMDLQIDSALSRLIKDPHEKRLADQQIKSAAAIPRTADAIFRQFANLNDSRLPSPARSSHHDFFHQLHCMLILDRVDEAEKLLSDAAAGAHNKDGDFLVFAVHLYLYLHPDCPQQPLNSCGLTVVKAFIDYLVNSHQYSFVPYYAALLSESHRTDVYCKFLQSISADEQSVYIGMARSMFGTHALKIVQAFVSASLFGPQPVNNDAKIRILGSYDLLREGGSHGTAVQQALVYDANRLIRSFVTDNMFSFAEQTMKSASMKRLDEIISLKSEDQWDDNEVEFNGWALYVRAVHLFSLWQAHAATKPIKPVSLKPVHEHALTQQQQIVQKQKFTRLVNEYHAQSEQWSKLAKQIGATAASALLECLQHASRGFLRAAPASPVRSAQDSVVLATLRSRLVPELLLMLHRTCDQAGLASESVQIVNLIVDERYQLYTAMTLAERRTMLMLIKESYVRYELDRSFQQIRSQQHNQDFDDTEEMVVEDQMQDEDEQEINVPVSQPMNAPSPRSHLLSAPLGAIDEQSTEILPEEPVAEPEINMSRRTDSTTSANSNDSGMWSESDAESVNEGSESAAKPKRRRARKDSQPRPTEVRRSSRLRKDPS